MTHIECDACGKTLSRGDLHIATVKRVGAATGRTFELCEDCAKKAGSTIAAFVTAQKEREK